MCRETPVKNVRESFSMPLERKCNHPQPTAWRRQKPAGKAAAPGTANVSWVILYIIAHIFRMLKSPFLGKGLLSRDLSGDQFQGYFRNRKKYCRKSPSSQFVS